MSNTDNHPLILLVIATSLVTAISGGVFGIWAKYDVLPSTLDNTYSQTSCRVESSEITSSDERCACHEDGLACTYEYPCIVIKVRTNISLKTLQLYKDLTSYTFSKKCSFYPTGKLCKDNSSSIKARAMLFKQHRGEVGANFSCYVNDLNTPDIVIAEGCDKNVAKFIVFVISIVLFYFPLAFINCFFFYKWKVVAYLGAPFKRHNRVASLQSNSIADNAQRRDTAFTTAQYETE